MIILLDNYDSFTYNIYQMVGTINPEIKVIRNDALSVAALLALKPKQIILSPGPGYPKTAGVMPELIQAACEKIPILGICLGHQALGEAFGAKIVEAPVPVHGKVSPVALLGNCPLLEGLSSPLTVGRYHSLVIDEQTLPSCLIQTAISPDQLIMGIRHRHLPLFGLQFHPESILSEQGSVIMNRFLAM